MAERWAWDDAAEVADFGGWVLEDLARHASLGLGLKTQKWAVDDVTRLSAYSFPIPLYQQHIAYFRNFYYSTRRSAHAAFFVA